MTALNILIFSFLIPNEFNFSIGAFTLSPYRLVLLCLTPYLVFKFLNHGSRIHWCAVDILALAACIWPTISFGLNTNFNAAIESGGIQTLELVVPYFLVRFTVNSHRQRVIFSKTLFTMVAILFVLGLPEAIFGRHFTHELAGILTGKSYSSQIENRFGIWRALGPTDHAIIFGSLCTITLSLAFVRACYRKGRWINVGLSAGGAVLSASSAPMLAIIAQVSMLVWAGLMRGKRYRWWLLLFLILLGYVTIDVISNRDPIRLMFSYLLLNPDTGYARYYMWVYSFEIVGQTTWGLLFGYGYDIGIFQLIDNAYWRNLLENTIDSFWLVVMLRFGTIGLILFLLLAVLSLARSLRYVFGSEQRHKRVFMQAWFISTFAMTLIATTVHFWGFMASFYMILLATCVGNFPPRSRRKRVTEVTDSDRSNAFTRSRVKPLR